LAAKAVLGRFAGEAVVAAAAAAADRCGRLEVGGGGGCEVVLDFFLVTGAVDGKGG
jgi:hypothetical protein